MKLDCEAGSTNFHMQSYSSDLTECLFHHTPLLEKTLRKCGIEMVLLKALFKGQIFSTLLLLHGEEEEPN